jgi:hypothetical protein
MGSVLIWLLYVFASFFAPSPETHFSSKAAKQDVKKQTRLGHCPQMKSVKESVIVKALEL